MTPHGQRRERYREWLASRGLRFGFADELADRADSRSISATNDTPPVERWHAILPTVRLAESLREKYGATRVNSAYRSPAYNKSIKGATSSRHVENDALDLRCATGTPAEWAAFLRGLRADKVFTGGVGVYASFVHVDTRGTNADWAG